MKKVGRIASIWHYPVKGMAGANIKTAKVGENGVEGDRTWAVQDVARQEIQSCKFRPQLLRCRASETNGSNETSGTDLERPLSSTHNVQIEFPDGERLACGDSVTDARLSDLLGYESRLRSLEPASNHMFYQRYKADDHTWLKELKQTFEREPGEPLPDLDNLPPEMQQYVSQLGTFFLVAPLHILTTASVAYMQGLLPNSDWNIERFRPNIVIETLPEYQGLTEQDWLGGKLIFGGCSVECVDTAPRCGAVIREQKNIAQDSQILRSIVAEADQNLGIYGSATKSGQASVGDDVYLVFE